MIETRVVRKRRVGVLRLAAVSKGLVTTLVVLLVIFVAYYGCKAVSNDEPDFALNDSPLMYWVVCEGCKARTEMDGTAVHELPYDPQTGGLECPKCKKREAFVERTEGGMALMPEKP